MVVELKVQYCREKLKISFGTNRTFLRCTIFNNSVTGFGIFLQLFQSAEKKVFYNDLITRTKHVQKINL